MLKRLILISIITAVFLVISYSQDILAETSDTLKDIKSAVTVLPEKIIDNLYMAGSLGRINDMTVEMELYGPPYSKDKDTSKETFEPLGSIKLFFLAPNKLRTEKTIYCQGNSDIFIITIHDGKNIYNPYPGWPFPKNNNDNHHHSVHLPFNTDTQPQDQYRKYSLMGEEKLYGRDAYVITIDNEKEPVVKSLTVWIDKELFIPLKEEYITKDEKGTETKKTTLYKEPKQMPDGRWIPFRIERYYNDIMTCYILYKSVVINQGLSDELFNTGEPSLAPKH